MPGVQWNRRQHCNVGFDGVVCNLYLCDINSDENEIIRKKKIGPFDIEEDDIDT